MLDLHDDDPEQTSSAGAIPLRDALLEAHFAQHAVENDVQLLPGGRWVVGQGLRFGEGLAAFARPTGGLFANTCGGGCREDGVGPHRAQEHHGLGKTFGNRVTAVGGIGAELDASPRGPANRKVEHLAPELGLLAVGLVLGARARFGHRLLVPIEAEEHRQRPAAFAERHGNHQTQHDPAVTEGKDAPRPSGADGIDVAADAEDLGAFLGCQRIVEHQPNGFPLGDQAQRGAEQKLAPLIGRPAATREEAVEALVMAAARDIGDHQGLGDGVQSGGLYPPGEDDLKIGEAGACQRRLQDRQAGQERAQQELRSARINPHRLSLLPTTPIRDAPLVTDNRSSAPNAVVHCQPYESERRLR